MTTIYRIQDREGRGPWRPGFSHKWAEVKHSSWYETYIPWTQEFNGLQLRLGPYYGCGCLTPEQLRGWFSETEYKELLHHGYQAVRMEADNIIARSATQCVFERAKPLFEGGVLAFNLYDRPQNPTIDELADCRVRELQEHCQIIDTLTMPKEPCDHEWNDTTDVDECFCQICGMSMWRHAFMECP